MGKQNRRTQGNRKLMDKVVIVKEFVLDYPPSKGKIGGQINIKSLKLKNAIGKKVRVIIKTHYSG